MTLHFPDRAIKANHKKASKVIVYFPVLKVCAMWTYSTALVFEETFAKTSFAVVSCAVPGRSEFYSPVCLWPLDLGCAPFQAHRHRQGSNS